MELLLDTVTFLWFLWDDPQLSATARALITDPNNHKFISPASYWEIAIKLSTNKLSLGEPYEAFIQVGIQRNHFDILPITVRQTSVVAAMPFHHRDPFDRLLAAQALAEFMPLVSPDPVFDLYHVSRLW